MKITLDVSHNNEATSAPFWLILDPKQNMDCDIFGLAGQITGVFFSREKAESYLKAHRYNFTERAKVFCHSGCYSYEYANAYDKAEKETELLDRSTGIDNA